MKKKFFAAVLLLAGAALSAAELVTLDLNYYSTEATSIRPVGALPRGVSMVRRVKFGNPKLKGFAYRVLIDLGKTKSAELKFVVTGSGRICPSLSGRITNARGKPLRGLIFQCTSFEFCDEPSAVKLPAVIRKWTNMLPRGIDVSDGETLTFKATFEKAE